MNGEVKNNKTGLLPAGGSPVAFFESSLGGCYFNK